MGKGIALQFKRAFPAMFKAYAAACRRHEVELGRMHVWSNPALTGPRFVINFPTKAHWKARSRIVDIDAGLQDLIRVIRDEQISSVAVPPLGCGNGGLDWGSVKPLIEAAFQQTPEVEVRLYAPEGAPVATAMPVKTPRPRMTVGKAALISLISGYSQLAVEVSQIEIQKLMYFLQLSGQDLGLNYVKALYGPYADNLRHSLKAVEGHYLSGFGDGSRPALVTEPIEVLPGAAEQANTVLAEDADTRRRIETVLQLTDGFESVYGMELLATVHWVASDDPTARDDVTRVVELVRDWSARKNGLFTENHIVAAWRHLLDEGWLAAAD